MLPGKVFILSVLTIVLSTYGLKAQVTDTTKDNPNSKTLSNDEAELRRVKYLKGLRKISSDKELRYADSVKKAKGISESDMLYLAQDYQKMSRNGFDAQIEFGEFKWAADVYVDADFITRAKVIRPSTKKDQEKSLEELKKLINTKTPQSVEIDRIMTAQLGKTAPLFSVVDVDGVKYDLQELKGKVVVLNFWFIGCGPCKKEMPKLNEIVGKYKSQDVVFLAFEVNSNSADKIKALTKNNFNFTHIPSRRGDVDSKYQVKTYPTSYVIDQTGVIRFGLAGYNPFKLPEMDKTIEDLLKNKSVAQDRAINFEHSSWAEIKAKAAKEKKTIFLDAFTSWCGPCKKMAKEVFNNSEVADYFNANFINAKIDMEKGEGPQLAKLYAVKAYPSLLFIDAEGKLISKREGTMDVSAFIDFGKRSISGEPLENLIAQYNKGDRSFEFMKSYLNRMEGLRKNIGGIVEDYFKHIPQAKLQTKESWYFISRYIKNEESPVFKFVLKNQKAYEQKFSAVAVSDYFVAVYRNSIQKTANSIFPVEDMQELKAKIHAMNFAGKTKLELQCDAIVADMNGDLKSYVDLMGTMFSKYPESDKNTQIELLNGFCWKLLQRSSDPYVLKKVTKIAEVAMQSQKAAFMDTYASLLFEIGDIDQAIEVEEKILAMLKVKPDSEYPISECEARMEKFKRKKAL